MEMGTCGAEVAAGLTVAAIVGLVTARKLIARWWSARRATRSERAQRREVEQAEKARAERTATRSAEAVADGRIVEVSRSGRMPVEVRLSDGSSRYYFCGDLPAYKRAVEAGRYSFDRSFHTNPPPPSPS
jgi:hypothetical protein